MGIFSKKTKFEDLSQASQKQFVIRVAEVYVDSFDRWGRFPGGPESLASIKLVARNCGYRASVDQCVGIHEAALAVALEMRRQERS